MSVSITDIRLIEELSKAGPFIGPRGGKWADAKHTIPYKEGGEPSSKDTVKVTDEVLTAHSGQVDALLTAKRGGRQAGRLHYSVSSGVPHIQKIEVGEKRAGVGSKLVAELASKYGYANIEWGMMTESGNALRSALDRKYGFDREAATPKKIDGQAFGQKYGKVLDHNHISNKTQEVYVEMDSKKKADALASEVKRLGGEVDMQSHDGTFWADVRLPTTTKKSISLEDIEGLELLSKAGPFIGPRGGKWADAKHTIPYKEGGKGGPDPSKHAAYKQEYDALTSMIVSLDGMEGFLSSVARKKQLSAAGKKQLGDGLTSAITRLIGAQHFLASPTRKAKVDAAMSKKASDQMEGAISSMQSLRRTGGDIKPVMNQIQSIRGTLSKLRSKVGGFVSETKKSISLEGLELLTKAGPFIGPRGGKWADAKHTIPYSEGDKKKPASGGKVSHGITAAKLDAAPVGSEVHMGNAKNPSRFGYVKRTGGWHQKNMKTGDVHPTPGTHPKAWISAYSKMKIVQGASEPKPQKKAEWSSAPKLNTAFAAKVAKKVDSSWMAQASLDDIRNTITSTHMSGMSMSDRIENGPKAKAWKQSLGKDELVSFFRKVEDRKNKGRLTQTRRTDESFGKSISIEDIEDLELLAKAGPFIGPKGGKWADAKHTIAWKDKGSQKQSGLATSSKGTIAIAAALKKVGFTIDKNNVQKKGNKIVKMPLRDGKGGVLALGATPVGRIAMVGDKASVATAQMRLASVGINTKPHESKAVEESGMGGLQISPGKDGTFNWNEAAFQSPEKKAPKVIPQVPAMEGMSPLGLGTQTPMSIPEDSTGGIVADPQPSPQELAAAFTLDGAESTYDSAPKFEEHPDAPKDKSVQTFATYAEAADLTPAKVKKTGPDAILKYVQGMTAINAHRTEAKSDAPVRYMAATVGPNSRVFIGAAGGTDDAVQLSGPGQTQTVPRSEVKPGDVYFITGVTPGRHEMHVVVGAPHKTKIGSSDWHSNPAAKIASTYAFQGNRVIEYRSKAGNIAASENRFSKFSKSVSIDEVEALELLVKG